MSAPGEPRAKAQLELVAQLPPEMRREVRDCVESLAAKRRRKAEPMKLDWRGGLSSLREQYTSVELRNAVSRWIAEAD